MYLTVKDVEFTYNEDRLVISIENEYGALEEQEISINDAKNIIKFLEKSIKESEE